MAGGEPLPYGFSCKGFVGQEFASYQKKPKQYMARLFSKRYSNSLTDERLKVSIPTPVRERLWMALEEYSEFDCLKGEYTAITEL
ncbi:MAG: hypothetical protein GTN65_02500, partial [Armatimonadetes bacterium]|nr:hypothetical protein [Armatimonadota bacterium]NIO95977.1 hypothetical protein [Armatimonadota bacterium]